MAMLLPAFLPSACYKYLPFHGFEPTTVNVILYLPTSTGCVLLPLNWATQGLYVPQI